MDQRSLEKQIASVTAAMDRVMSARRAIVDVRLPRVVEDEALRLTSEILDHLEQHGNDIAVTSDEAAAAAASETVADQSPPREKPIRGERSNPPRLQSAEETGEKGGGVQDG